MNEQTDTQPEAEAVMLDLLRQTPVWRKLQLMEQLNQMTYSLVMGELRQRHPQVGEMEQRHFWAERLFGGEIALQLSEMSKRKTHAL